MGKHRIKLNYRRRVLRLPDLDHCKLAVLNSLGSPASRRVYQYAIDQFVAWYCSEPRLAFNRIVVATACTWNHAGWPRTPSTSNWLPCADSGLLSPELAAGISRVKGVKQLGFRPIGFQIVGEKVRRERRWTSAGASPARELVRSTR